MEKILFVNACVRENSRTLSLANFVLGCLNQEYTELNLQSLNPQPLNGKTLKKEKAWFRAAILTMICLYRQKPLPQPTQ